jgi:hypothetical protein
MPVATACCLAVLVAAARPQTPPPAPSSITPVRASIDVRLPAGKGTYHVGEEIPLELEFRGTADKDYYFSTASYDHSGRMRTEQYEVTPGAGILDPLSDLFASGNFVGGGGFGWHPLDDTPFMLHVSLNDWVRFTRPGTYSVVVTSTRLERYSSQPAPALTSAPVDLTIVPIDGAWASAELIRASELIDRGLPTDVRHGAAILRYLGTEGAALALLQRFGAIAKVDAWEIEAGLISSPDRALIIKEMDTRVDDKACLDANFLGTLTRLRVLQDLHPIPGDGNARSARQEAVQVEYETRCRAALARRPATPATLEAELEQFHGNPSPNLRQQIAADLEQHPAEAAEAFVALRPSTQQIMLDPTFGWTYVNRLWILPALRQVYAAWHGSPLQNGFPGVGDFVLRRLYELAPDEGRRLVLEEIQTGDHAIRYDALAILPDPSLPELDAPLQARYTSPRTTDPRDIDRGTTAWLMARYGSPALLPFVTDSLSRPATCVVEGGLIAYVLKYDPTAAMKFLDPSLGRRTRNTCADPLPTLAEHYWDNRVESAAIAGLMDTNIGRVTEAAQLLGSHGSSAAKQPLLDRLTKWSAEWQGRAAELIGLGPQAGVSPALIENNVVNALFHNERFALTIDEAASIRALCVTDGCRTNVDGLARGIQ